MNKKFMQNIVRQYLWFAIYERKTKCHNLTILRLWHLVNF